MAGLRTDSPKLALVDGLRGVAVLAVIAFHHRLETERFEHTALYAVLAPTRFGWVGVHLFLVLSGFCLAHSLLRREDAGVSVSLGRYLSERFRRIGPTYYAAIVLYLGAALVLTRLSGQPVRWERVDVRQIGVHLAFVHGLWADTIEAINSPFWSLSLEFQFYLILPLLFAACLKLGHRAVIAVLTLSIVIWRAYIVSLGYEVTHLLNGFFLSRVSEFGFGVLVAFWFRERCCDELWEPRRGDWLIAVGLILVGIGVYLPGLTRLVVSDQVIGVGWALVLAVALGSARRGGWVFRVLSGRWIVLVGSVSYSLYLTHSLALAVVDRNYRRVVGETTWVTDLVLLAVASVFVGAVGIAFYLGVERRFLRSVDLRSRSGEPSRSNSPMFKPERARKQVGSPRLANR